MRRVNKGIRAAAAAMFGLAVGLSLLVSAATADEEPVKDEIPVSCDPAVVQFGGTLTVSGGTADAFGFAAGDTVMILVDGRQIGTAVVDGDRMFSVDVVVDFGPGTVTVIAFSAGAQGQAECTVTPQPSIAVTPAEGRAGDEVTVSGSDFDPGDNVTLQLGGLPFADDADIVADDDGAFTVIGTVPDIDPGRYQVTATRGRIPEAADAEFGVIETPPPSTTTTSSTTTSSTTTITPTTSTTTSTTTPSTTTTIEDDDDDDEDDCLELFDLCWWWWILIVAAVLFLLLFLPWWLCRRGLPFEPGEEIPGSGWVACRGRCKLRRGRCVADEEHACQDGGSCEMFRRRRWSFDRTWERVVERRQRFRYCHHCACARRIETGPSEP